MKIYKEKSGVISEKPIYTYIGSSLFNLLILFIFEYKNDKHLGM